MKKIIALAIAVLMVLSMIPVVTLSASAAGQGDWITKRAPGESEEELAEKVANEGHDGKYKPAAGYYYDNTGFHTVSPNFRSITPFSYIRTTEAVNLKDGFSFEWRVDEYEYCGFDEDGNSLGKDQWMCVSIFPGSDMVPGSTEYGSGWLILIRGQGNGTAQVQPHWTEGRKEDGTGGTFGGCGGFPSVEVPMDDEGKEIYSFDIQWNGTKYDITVNGVAIDGGDRIDAAMPDGNAYITLCAQTGLLKDDQAMSFSILKTNGSVPTGSGKADPDENVNSDAEYTPSDSIPAGQPCFVWDATCQVMRKLPETGQNCNIAAKGDGTVHITATGSQIYFTAGPSSDYSYHAEDFPILTMLLRNYNGDDGQYWYAAGDISGAQNDAVVNWSLWDDGCEEYEIGEDLYNLVVLDMKDYDEERWVNRIRGQRLVFNNLLPEDAEYGEFDLCFFACFRSIEDAQAFSANWIKEKNNLEEIPTEAPTEAPTEKPTEAPTEALEDATQAGEAATTADGETAAEGATAADGEATDAAADEGCASVIGGSVALILTAIAAAVALKKKH